VWAESAGLQHGSTFVVQLPVAPAERAGTPTERPSHPTLVAAARRIIVVDDNGDAAETLAALLALDGHQVRTANSGAAALALTQVFTPEIAFVDIGMPGMNGYEVARRIRGDARLGAATLVAVTGWGQAEDRRLSREAGFDHHLTKPVEADDVRRLVAGLSRHDDSRQA
jgi:CheY-like chemotaxis protein